ncbi:MAG TPA: SpoIIE family protein phosphatase [Terriglobales bacterium]|nr:SpoIIE family protein phosphatase [Terriglobales bacterium]
MGVHLPTSSDLQTLARRILHPKSKLGKTTLWFGYLAFVLEILRAIFRPAPDSMLSGWAGFISFVFFCCALLTGLRWVRQKLMWRLRNRLIVTYVFIGVIPIILLLSMALLAGFLFAGQFATYVAMSELQSELKHLQATNRSMAAQFHSLAVAGKFNEQLAGEIAGASAESFHHRSVSVWIGDKGFVLAPPGEAAPQPIHPSPALKGDFAGFVLDHTRLELRAVTVEDGAHPLTVISSLPITADLLRHAASELGKVSIFPPEKQTTTAPMHKPSDKTKASANRDQIIIDDDGSRTTYRTAVNVGGVEAGSVPPALNALDVNFPFGTRINLVDWRTGETLPGLLWADTRPSMIYATLFSTLGDKASAVREILIGIGVLFGVIELIALFIGMRLTRSMTRSVADLYSATEHINRGELQHRIPIRTRDQMAALEQSFNSMAQSLASLIAEQKEKQRMESELAIAHEVQALLFPADQSGMRTLEVHGVCRPARTVSGDYYDFIPLREDRLLLAVGDISGKGISAALLMATVHAFVRAYALEVGSPARAVFATAGGVEPERTLALGAGVSGANALKLNGASRSSDGDLSPAFLMSTLNYQLFRSTPPEKYATLFLACYDSDLRSLTYSNAGHLPPLVLSRNGNVRKLGTSGTVVGLFDGMEYDESAVTMQPGDILVAYSDGITEPENEFGEFGEERLIELILQHRDQSLARISEVVTGAVTDWIAGGEQPDDVTLVLARAR